MTLDENRRRTARLILDRDADSVAVTSSDVAVSSLRGFSTDSYLRRGLDRMRMKLGRVDGVSVGIEDAVTFRRRLLGDRAAGPPRFLVRVDEYPISASPGCDLRLGLTYSERFHDILASEGVPYLLSVVPNPAHDYLNPTSTGARGLDDRDRQFLTRIAADGVTFAQHGTTHRTRYAHGRRHSELCGLPATALRALLADGAMALEAASISARVFVPPFNRFDRSQWPTLSERFNVVTGGPESVALIGLQSSPVWWGTAVYVPAYPPLYAGVRALVPAVSRLIGEQPGTWVAVVLHPAWELEEDEALLRRFARLVRPFAVSWEDFLAAVARSADAAAPVLSAAAG